MKILYVVHYFLPEHQAGTEIYTGLLARALLDLGHQTAVFTSEDGHLEPGRFFLKSDQWEGIPVTRLVRGEPPDFKRTYVDADVDREFRSFLAEYQPDVVHFQHTFRLSATMLGECKNIGIPSYITLADYWFLCPPILLLQPGFELCPGPEPDRCARCGNALGTLYSGAPGSSLAGSDNKILSTGGTLVKTVSERLIRAAHAVKRKLPRPLVDKARKWSQAREQSDPESAYQQRRSLLEDRRTVMKRALADADLVIAPSNFLREKMIEAGMIEPDKIIHSDYGFNHEPFKDIEHKESHNIRFGFIGTPVEHKGVHVAIEAIHQLAETNAELKIYGDLDWFPAYARRLRRLAKNTETRFMGRFDNREAASVLASLDVLIVPSLWYENSPLTIHEAFMAGVPVIVSDVGGMAELVADGGGLTFKVGDSDDLARVMRRLIEQPGDLAQLRKTIPMVKPIKDNANELIKLYSRK